MSAAPGLVTALGAELTEAAPLCVVVFAVALLLLLGLRNLTTVARLQAYDTMFQPTINRAASHHRAIQIKMTKVPIPFTFKLVDSSKTTYAEVLPVLLSKKLKSTCDKGEVQCSISSQVHYTLRACWGVSIRDLHTTLWRPWEQLYNALAHDIPSCQYRAPDRRYSDHTERILRLQLPPSYKLRLGNPPRLYYPLVVLLTRDDSLDQPYSDETVALVNIVHIRDSVCPLPTSVLAQYLKQANGQLSCLKQLYLATGNPTTYELSEPSNDQLCAVCQAFPLSRALLPCRHTCVCAQCFSKLEKCPMCRSPILSYFCIRGEDYVPVDVVSTASKNPLNFFDTWNDRLIDFLGFR